MEVPLCTTIAIEGNNTSYQTKGYFGETISFFLFSETECRYNESIKYTILTLQKFSSFKLSKVFPGSCAADQ